MLSAFGYWAKWVGSSVVFVVLLALVLPFVTAHLYGTTAIGAYAAIILFAALVSSSFYSFAQVGAQVVGRIGTLSLLTLSDMVIRYGAAIALTLAGLGALGTSLGHLLGAILLVGLAFAVYRSLEQRDPLLPSIRSVMRRAWQLPWRTYLSQSMWVWVDRNFGMLFQALPIAMVGLVVSSAEVAYFKLAFGYLNTGMAVLGPLSVLLNTEFARIQVRAPERLRSAFVRMSLAGFGLAAAVTLFAAFVGRWVFLLLYGPAYIGGVPLVYGLVLYGALFGFGIALGPMWRAVGKVRTSVAINVAVLGIGVPLGLWLVHAYGTWGGVIMVTLWYAGAHLTSFVYLLRILHRAPVADTMGNA